MKPTTTKFVNENNQNKLRFYDLVGKKFRIELGSGVESTTWDKDSLIKKISDVIKHNLFDSDFYYNWTGNREEYFNVFKKTTLTSMIVDLDSTLNKYFVFKHTPYSINEVVLVFKNDDNQLWIDNWFQTNENISDELKKDYYNYRKKYAGVSLLINDI